MRSITRYLIPGGLLAGAITLGALGLSTGASTPNDVQQPVIPHLVSIPPQGTPVVPAPVNPPPVVISGPPVVAPVAPKAPVIPVPKAPAPPVIKAPVTTPPPPPVVTQTCIPASSCTVTSSVSNTSTVVTSPPAPTFYCQISWSGSQVNDETGVNTPGIVMGYQGLCGPGTNGQAFLDAYPNAVVTP